MTRMVNFKLQNEGGIPINVVLCHDEDGGIVIHLFTKNLRKEHYKKRVKLIEGQGIVIAEDDKKPPYIG